MAGDNFGCGSSREHAPWALTGYGFRAVICTSFADIFRNNSLKNGLIPIIVDDETHKMLFDLVEEVPNAELTVDLASQTLIFPNGSVNFPIDPFNKTCLLNGVDELGYILGFEKEIAAFETDDRPTETISSSRIVRRNYDIIQIYDTTLRDGTQSEGFTLSANDKVRIAQRLDDLGVAFIEGGWPGSNPKDVEFFERARDMEWKNALIAAFGSTCRVKGGPEDDANIKALLDSNTPVCTIFGKTWTLHVKEVLQTTLEDNLRIIEQSVAYLKSNGKRVIYDAEHFFDGYKADSSYALETLQAAIRGGAETVVLCDTNGGTLPWEVEHIIRDLKLVLDIPFGIHTHNDCEMRSHQFADRSPRRRNPGAGNHQRCRRALRQCQPDLDHGGP